MTDGTKTAHAPGPWTYHIGQDYTEFYDASGETFMTVTHAMDKEDAALIAATPDLLAACRTAIGPFAIGRSKTDIICEAIDKATH